MKEYVSTVFQRDLVVPRGTTVISAVQQIAETTLIVSGLCIARTDRRFNALHGSSARFTWKDKRVTDRIPLWLLDPPFRLPVPFRVNEREPWLLTLDFDDPPQDDLRLYIAVVASRLRDAI